MGITVVIRRPANDGAFRRHRCDGRVFRMFRELYYDRLARYSGLAKGSGSAEQNGKNQECGFHRVSWRVPDYTLENSNRDANS